MYKLDLPKTWCSIHPIFNEVLLTPFRTPLYPSQEKPPPPPPINAADNIYEVEKILDSKLICGKLHYLVHWKGYPIEERTWEPVSNITAAGELVKEFHKTHPSAPRPITRGSVRFTTYENFTEPTLAPRMLFDWDDGVFDRVDHFLDCSQNTSIEIV